MILRSMFFCSAILRASGDALMRSDEDEGGGAATGEGAASTFGAGAGGAPLLWARGEEGEVEVVEATAPLATTFSPAWPIYAITSPTFAV